MVVPPASLMAMIQEATPVTAAGWTSRPEFLVPLGFGVLLLLVLAILKLPDFLSWRRARAHEVLLPIDLVQLNPGQAPAVVDVRTEAEFHGPKGHVRGALNIPLAGLVKHIGAHVADTKQLVVLVDWNDKLSHQAALLLEARGYRWVRPLKGGLRAWRAMDLPIAITGGRR